MVGRIDTAPGVDPEHILVKPRILRLRENFPNLAEGRMLSLSVNMEQVIGDRRVSETWLFLKKRVLEVILYALCH